MSNRKAGELSPHLQTTPLEVAAALVLPTAAMKAMLVAAAGALLSLTGVSSFPGLGLLLDLKTLIHPLPRFYTRTLTLPNVGGVMVLPC